MTAHQLGSVRIALLRHDRATRRIGIGQRHETEGLAGPNDEFFRQSRKVQTALRSGHQIIEGKIPVRYRSEEHTSELQSLMRISYAVFCLKKKTVKYKRSTQVYNQTHIKHTI